MMDYKSILNHISDRYSAVLKENLVGIYVHGSLGFGCFNPQKSDIDFITVVNESLSQSEKEEMIKALMDLSPYEPVRGFEMSVVKYEYCQKFIYPTPFELHYSIAHLKACQNNISAYCSYMHGADSDLAAHFTVIRKVGYTLLGRPIEEVFGYVPRESFLDSIMLDISNANYDVKDNPVYVILNLCRVIAYKKEKLILSKNQGGNWAIINLSQRFSGLIQRMVNIYESGNEESIDIELASEFCDYALNMLYKE